MYLHLLQLDLSSGWNVSGPREIMPWICRTDAERHGEINAQWLEGRERPWKAGRECPKRTHEVTDFRHNRRPVSAWGATVDRLLGARYRETCIGLDALNVPDVRR